MFCMQHFLKQHSFLQASDLTLRGYITTFNEPVCAGYVALVQKTKNKKQKHKSNVLIEFGLWRSYCGYKSENKTSQQRFIVIFLHVLLVSIDVQNWEIQGKQKTSSTYSIFDASSSSPYILLPLGRWDVLLPVSIGSHSYKPIILSYGINITWILNEYSL